MVECSSERRSNARSDPSAPTLTNASVLCGTQATSYTSRSCAINWVTAVLEDISQTVQVVSIDEVTIKDGDIVFQANEVRGGVEGFGFLLWDEALIRICTYSDNTHTGQRDFLAEFPSQSDISLSSNIACLGTRSDTSVVLSKELPDA
jgi:hypothetical protein